jgi:hypothetical protein
VSKKQETKMRTSSRVRNMWNTLAKRSYKKQRNAPNLSSFSIKGTRSINWNQERMDGVPPPPQQATEEKKQRGWKDVNPKLMITLPPTLMNSDHIMIGWSALEKRDCRILPSILHPCDVFPSANAPSGCMVIGNDQFFAFSGSPDRSIEVRNVVAAIHNLLLLNS